jgi:hypothetical protein
LTEVLLFETDSKEAERGGISSLPEELGQDHKIVKAATCVAALTTKLARNPIAVIAILPSRL